MFRDFIHFSISHDFIPVLWSTVSNTVGASRTDLSDINQEYQPIPLIWSNKTDISSDNLSKINRKPEFRSNKDCLRIHNGAVWSFDKLLILNASLWASYHEVGLRRISF